MDTPRIVELRVKGMRTLDDVTIRFGATGLTVMIGESGAGKSTVIEALAILSAMFRDRFSDYLANQHGGPSGLLRHGASGLTIGVTVERGTLGVTFDAEIVHQEPFLVLSNETVREFGADADFRREVVRRTPALVKYYTDGSNERRAEPPDDGSSTVAALSARSLDPALVALRLAFERIDVHFPFDVMPRWARNGGGSPLRATETVQRATRLERLGGNLANCYFALHTEYGPEHWAETLEYVQLGLGTDVKDVVARPGTNGQISLALRLRDGDGVVPALAMSDGMLAYLAFVALVQMPTERSILAFDEPDLHLHPHLLSRVVDLLGRVGERCPVLLATHSDRLLDLLPDPVASTVVFELDADRKTRVLRPDPDRYRSWKREFAGIGQLRDAGHLPTILEPDSGRVE